MKFDLLSAAKHAGVYKSQAPGHRNPYILYGDPLIFMGTQHRACFMTTF